MLPDSYEWFDPANASDILFERERDYHAMFPEDADPFGFGVESIIESEER
jgi:hypothetical protein